MVKMGLIVNNKFNYIFILFLLINISFIYAQSIISEIDSGLINSQINPSTKVFINPDITKQQILEGDEITTESLPLGDENDQLYYEILKNYESQGYVELNSEENDIRVQVDQIIEDITEEIKNKEGEVIEKSSQANVFTPETEYDNIPEQVSINEYNNIKPEELKKKISETKKVISKTKKKISPKTKEELEKELSFWQKFQKFMDNLSNKVGKTLAGNAIKDFKYRDIELPPIPVLPGDPQDITIPTKKFKFVGLTGNAIIGVPDWSFDGSKQGDFIWSASFTPKPRNGPIQHFDLSLQSNMSVKNAVNGIVYNKGYYLNDKQDKWEEFSFSGTRIGNTHWLRERGDASITLNDVTDKDYNIFIAYSCLKLMEQDWRCQDGKWIVFVVETGNVSYNLNTSDITMEYNEIKDLNISDLPSILRQLNLTAFEFQPTLYDALLISNQENLVVNQNDTQKISFIVANIGNRNLSNLIYELDIGENSLAEVVAADIPENVNINESKSGSITLLFKERGNFKFNLYLIPHPEEVDTSDNLIRFNVTIGDIIRKNRTDPLNVGWNRNINYTVRENYSYRSYSGSSLNIISGTNKMRTVWGGYWNRRSINPTMEVNINPLLSEEALFSTPYLYSIFIGGEMLTGDRETVKYYVVIKNSKNGKIYTTPIMESMYKYYYNPKELIPDFELCTDYISKVFIVGNNKEIIDIRDPTPFNLCNDDFNKYLVPFRSKRLLKLDGNYLVVTGGLDGKYFEEDQNIDFKIEFSDPKSPNKKYLTPIINTKQGYALFKMEGIFPNRYIDYNNGEVFSGTAILIDKPNAREDSNLKYKPRDEKIHFIWNDWNIIVDLRLKLELIDQKIKIKNSYYLNAISAIFQVESAQSPGVMKSFFVDTFDFSFPSYFSKEKKFEAIFNSKYNLVIKDLNEERIFYDGIIDCAQYKKYLNFNNLENAPEYMHFSYVTFNISLTQKIEYSACYNQVFGYSNIRMINLGIFNKIKPIPSFIQGHYYDFIFKVTSENSDQYTPTDPTRILYLDAFQLLANNPILRTRFMNLENHPNNFKSVGSLINSDSEYIPSFSFQYFPKNSKFNYENGLVEKQNTKEREIKIQDLVSMYTSDYYEDFKDENSLSPVFDYVDLSVIQLKNTEQLDISKNQFNCKLGRFDIVCYRSNSGYSITYVDSLNGFLYKINLFNQLFLKKYRDNPQLYDSVIYDILSEIERNPIQSFETPYQIDYDYNIYTVRSIYQKSFPFDPYYRADCTGDITMLKSSYSTKYINPELPSNFYVNTVGFNPEYSFNVPNFTQTINVEVYDFSDSKIIGSKDITLYESTDFKKKVNCFLYDLKFVNNHYYKIVITNKKSPSLFFWLPVKFQYKDNYYNYITTEFSNDLRRIPELNTEILGPFYFFNYSRPCETLFRDGKDYCYFNYYHYFNVYGARNDDTFYEAFSTFPFTRSRNFDSDEFIIHSSVNPYNFTSHNTNEFISKEELKENIFGEKAKQLDSLRVYSLKSKKFKDLYSYYYFAPSNLNKFNTSLTNISCNSYRSQYSTYFNVSEKLGILTLVCQWGNIDKLMVYTLYINQIFPGKSENDLYNLDDNSLNDFKNNYAEKVLSKHLEWYPSTALLNTNFDAFD